MKNRPIILLIITSIILVLVTVLSYFNVQFPLVFYLTVIGQVFLIYTVYSVLTNNYKTTKTFDDWYEDHPIGDEDL
ncbi:MAG: hypothetical protein ACQEWD_15565 [Bacteroidota bacterium]|uniref:Uncharacterized protein n=1 Tax=Salegentibacter flavus TaxID=287099 RepID=A0A1I5CKX5_9FLAO|nr:hypothetical protein [Salegentibacter flavus]SFN87556.1 hypothetical protein SAMN05660413_02900 [Salegentibacter flavus]